ncbi:MAG: riboflavin biosynthesis protein RibF [Saprospiraceae bacterium]|nr:riboflavin biosynthesis protein RibF [Saprospiraceae bacterium]
MRVFTDLNALPSFNRAVLTIGSFDGVHTGHRRILEKVQSLARECGGESVVITFDPHPRTVLQPHDRSFKLLSTTAEKISLLASCGIDNVVVVPFSLEFARQEASRYVEDFLISAFSPRYIVIGYDHRFGSNREGDISFLKKYEQAAGFEVIEIPAQEVDEIAVSSSKIRRALDASDVALANRLLGYPFFFTGKVVSGRMIGRTIGFPTANIEIQDPFKLTLPQGIYAARARLASPDSTNREYEVYGAMLYIGSRPTLDDGGSPSIEINLLDFEGDLYGREMQVEVLDFIRPDKKMEDLEALKQQIEADKAEIVGRLQVYERDAGTAAFPPQVSGESARATEADVMTASDDPQAPSVAVVILNYNTRRHLEQYLPSVVAHSPGARIVVADNGSPDDSLAFLEQHYPDVVRIDLAHNYGFAEGYNRALAQVKADIYVILNSDVEVTAGWMEPVLAAMERDRGIAIAQPKILAWRQKTRFEYAGAAGGWIDALGYPFCRGRVFHHREEDTGQYDDPEECFWAAGAAFFIRAELYHGFGGFDGDYFAHNEEIDLCWRLKRAGYSVWCIPQSVVYHLGGGTLEYESPRKVLLNFRNSLYSLLKNEPARKLIWLIPARFLLDGLAGVRFALKGQFRAIWAIVLAHVSFYSNFRKTVRKRFEVSEMIDRQKRMPSNRSGIYRGSIIIEHYLRRIKEFSKLDLK